MAQSGEERPPDIDLVRLEGDRSSTSLADRLAELIQHARSARQAGAAPPGVAASTVRLVAELLSYRDGEDPPGWLVEELRHRAASREPNAGPGLALARRALAHWGERIRAE